MGSIDEPTPVEPTGAAEGAESARVRWSIRWAGLGAFAVGDQALFAGTNFLVSVVLARHLDPAGYGSFALAHAVFWLLGAGYVAVLPEPMIVFGPGRLRASFRTYLARVIEAHVVLTIPLALLTALLGLLLGRLWSPPVGQALLGLAAAIPLLLLAFLGRAANYARMRPGGSILGSALYCAIVLLCLRVLQIYGWLTPGTAFLALGAGGGVAGAVTLALVRPKWSADRILLPTLAGQHWSYGRWALATAVATWIPLNVYFLALPSWSGLAGGAGLKAVMNLAQPALHTLMALSNLLVPSLVQRNQVGGRSAVAAAGWRFLAALVAMTVCYLAAVLLSREWLLDLLYGGKYREFVPALTWIVLVPVPASVTVVIGSMLRSTERPDLVFRSSSVAAAFTLTAGLGLALWGGVTGAAAAIAASYVVAGAVLWRYWRAGDSESEAQETNGLRAGCQQEGMDRQ